jgi:hypothetical protein
MWFSEKKSSVKVRSFRIKQVYIGDENEVDAYNLWAWSFSF